MTERKPGIVKKILKLAAAQKLSVKLGNVSFDFDEDQLEAVREMATRINQ